MPVPPAGTSSELLAKRLFEDLVGTINATLPDVDLFDDEHSIPWDEESDVFKPVQKLTIQELVGYIDSIMVGLGSHLEKEFNSNRITGAEYARTYIALTQSALQGAVQFALGKEQAFWMAAKTQADAITAQNQNELMRIQAMLARAQYALTKLKLASEDSAFGASDFQLTNILPSQNSLLKEQKEAQRAQTLDTRSDGENRAGAIDPVTNQPRLLGLLGIQKALYDQQITSYREDVKVKAAKIFSDLWVTQKTINEGTPTPLNAQEPKFNEVLTVMRSSAGVAVP